MDDFWIQTILNVAAVFSFLAIIPELQRAIKYRHDLHESMSHNILHGLGNGLVALAMIWFGAWVAALVELFKTIVKFAQAYWTLKRKQRRMKEAKAYRERLNNPVG